MFDVAVAPRSTVLAHAYSTYNTKLYKEQPARLNYNI